jgi:hypothetical protein
MANISTDSNKSDTELITEANERLRRVETRLMRGFEEIGVDLYDQKDWLSVDEPSKTIYVATLGRSIQVINNTAKKQGAVMGKIYDVVWRGKALVNLQIY